MVRLSEKEVLGAKDRNQGFVVGVDGKQTRPNAIDWPGPPDEIAYVSTYVFSILPPGTVPVPDDEGYESPALPSTQQTTIPAPVAQVISSNVPANPNCSVRLLTGSLVANSPLFLVSTSVDRTTTTTEGSCVWKFEMRPWGEQIDELVRKGSYARTLALLITPDITALLHKSTTWSRESLPPDFDATSTCERLLDIIQYPTTEVQFVTDHGGLDNLESAVTEASQLGEDILSHFRGQFRDEAEEYLRARGNTRTLAHLLAYKRSPRGSEDSQTTAVEGDTAEIKVLPGPKETNKDKYRFRRRVYRGDATQGNRDHGCKRGSTGAVARVAGLWESLARDAMSSFEEEVPSKEPILRSLLKSRKWRERVERSSASKLKTWLERKITTDKPLNLQPCCDLHDPNCANAKAHNISLILSVSSKDLSNIEECLRGVEELVTSANHSISRTDRLIRRTVREVMVQNLRSRYPPAYTDIFTFSPDGTTPSAYFGLQNRNTSSAYPSPPNSNNSSRICSAQSSFVSLAATLNDEEDEDSRALRRLILRKIIAHIDGAFDEVDRANVWLRVVKSVLRDLRVRTSASFSRLPSSSPPASSPPISHC
ncbi:hypothetical protein F5141DRAFT_1233060 [Pisolithus sp. B1]|nr:hypothetical protein F5141DRAFT_1233060 [Pisolithus sp. B1]